MADETLPTPLTSRFTDALTLACTLHRAQARKGSQVPYVAHLLAVASIALEHGADEDEAIAAVLHDAVEDQGGAPTAALIRERFGAGVADIVVGCSDTDVVPKPPWRERKERYIAHVETASPSVRLVSASDKLHNARSLLADYRTLGEALWDRFTGGREGTLWYYRSLVTVFLKHGRTHLVEELDRVVSELEITTGTSQVIQSAHEATEAETRGSEVFPAAPAAAFEPAPEMEAKDCKWCSQPARPGDDFCSDDCRRNQRAVDQTVE